MKLGIEPAECYMIDRGRDADRPDLAIEVIWTAGGLDKLEAYAKLGVREVWHLQRGRISVHVLRGEKYQRASASKVLLGIDLDQLEGFLDRESTSRAVREYRTALRGGASQAR